MTDQPAEARRQPTFAHASEAEMARILDFYDVRWEYEPHVFPILWNLDGDVVESFAPDFWLPDLDLYVELTTLRQRLVRRKNRKLRRVRELYPGLRIKLFYARDFRALMLKYGKLALAAELSGALGQVPPVRPSPTVVLESGVKSDLADAGSSAAGATADTGDGAGTAPAEALVPTAAVPGPAASARPGQDVPPAAARRAEGRTARRRRARRRATTARAAAIDAAERGTAR